MKPITEDKTDIVKFRKEVRQAIADYMSSEGCSCCSDVDSHKEHLSRLAKILRVSKYEDNSGYNFSKYKSQK